MSDSKSPLERAREHTAAIRGHAKAALDADVYGDRTTVRSRLRSILSTSDDLDEAIGLAGTSSGTGASATGIDGIANPSGAQGAQGSAGQTAGKSAPRSFDPNVRRQEDQLASCTFAYNERMRQMGIKR